MATIIGDYIGTIIGIHSPIPYQAPGRSGYSIVVARKLDIIILMPLR